MLHKLKVELLKLLTGQMVWSHQSDLFTAHEQSLFVPAPGGRVILFLSLHLSLLLPCRVQCLALSFTQSFLEDPIFPLASENT